MYRDFILFKGVKIALVAVFALLLSLCNNSHKEIPDVSNIKIKPIKIKRYEQDLFSIDLNNFNHGLNKIMPNYQVFLGQAATDSIAINRLKEFVRDPQMLEIYNVCKIKYPNLNKIEEELNNAFKYFLYYFPNEQIPAIFTYVSGYDYEFPIKCADSTIIIALDMYLGSDHIAYSALNIPIYRSKRYTEENIVRDCFAEMCRTEWLIKNSPVTLLDHMIQEGKILYFLDIVLPNTPDTIKFGYSKQQMEWCIANEGNIWSYFIDKKALYGKDKLLINRFVGDAPFTVQFGKESAPRVANWIGYKIVSSYFKNNSKIKIEELFNNFDASQILNKSKYKPQKK